jgi:tRNA (guanine-N7-)-methyltransferase
MNKNYLSLDPFFPWVRQAQPVPWASVFGRRAPLELEIGFGLGDFLVREASGNPEKDFIGLELSWVLVRRALRKIALAAVKNARVLQADARVAIERVLEEKSVSRAYVLFPCPWPKKKHTKHRLLSNGFLKLLNSRLTDGGELLVVTDSLSHFEWMESQTIGTGLEGLGRVIQARSRTKYERKWHALGQHEVYEMRFIKTRHVAVPVKEDPVLLTHAITHFDPEDFFPRNDAGDIHVEFKEMLYDPKRRKAMVRVIVTEDSLLQNFWIEIVMKGDQWRIRPAKGCGMIPTVGVQRALDLTFEAAKAQPISRWPQNQSLPAGSSALGSNPTAQNESPRQGGP